MVPSPEGGMEEMILLFFCQKEGEFLMLPSLNL